MADKTLTEKKDIMIPDNCTDCHFFAPRSAKGYEAQFKCMLYLSEYTRSLLDTTKQPRPKTCSAVKVTVHERFYGDDAA
jgi:hypothetical protein